jgi:hypothetical protein
MQSVARYDMLSQENRFNPQNTQLQYQPLANQQSLSMMMPVNSSETWIEGNAQTYPAGLQYAAIQNSAIHFQQPRVHQVTVQKNVQVPKTVVVNI